MKVFTSAAPRVRLLALGACLLSASLLAQTLPPNAGVWRHQLIEGSQIVDDCPICDRIPIIMPLRGAFDLRCLDHGPLFSHYALENVLFETTGTNGFSYRISGRGTLEIGGQLALRQTIRFELTIATEANTNLCLLTNTTTAIRRWPMLQMPVDQENGTLTQQIHLDLNTAPFQEIWFSTVEPFTAGIWNAPSNLVSSGDLLSSVGATIKQNRALVANLGVMPPIPELGLKDFDVLSGGELAFAIEQPVFSESLGANLRPGDLLGSRGRIIKRNEQLVAGLQPDSSAVSDFGLDAVKVRDNGGVWFSVQTNFHSKIVGDVGHGDLLSEDGFIVRTNSQLIANFNPLPGTGDVGLRGIYVWPSAEIWFVTERAFYAQDGASFLAGDLLSDQGYVVYRRSELIAPFAPKALNPPQLDALFVVTDVISNENAPLLSNPRRIESPVAGLLISWQGAGQVFQVESSSNPAGPFTPLSRILPSLQFLDWSFGTNQSPSFYRLRQW